MSGMFWASVAGARANNLQAWMDYAGELEGRVNSLERDLGQLQDVLKEWQEEAVEANARFSVSASAFQEATGKRVREYLGEEEAERRLTVAREEEKKAYNLK
ncbi:MAG: hypothetical protein WCY71_08325 [Halothiobacillaceae bacterium]